MANSSTHVQIGETQFDLAAVGDWVTNHPWLVVIIILVAYGFWISRKDGLLGVMLDYRIRRHELNARLEKDRETLTLEYENRDKGTTGVADQSNPQQGRRR